MRAFEIPGWLGKKIRRSHGTPENFILFDRQTGRWFYHNKDGKVDFAYVEQLFYTDDWEEYQEPKPKKTVYEWMYKDSSYNANWKVHDILLAEKEAESYFFACFHETKYQKTGRQFEVIEG